MRRATISFSFLLCLLTVSAQSRYLSFVEFSAGGGWSTLTYSLNPSVATLQASDAGAFNMNLHVGYGLLFNSHIGFGFGVDISRYGANTRLQGDMIWNDVTDTDGERYNHITHINHWNDKQELYYVEVPLALYLMIPVSSVRLSAQVGVKYAFPFIRRSSFYGNVTHSGQYPDWGLTATDMPNHGFYTTDLEGKNGIGLQHQLFAFAKVGVMVSVSSRTMFFSHLYANCGMRSALGKTSHSHDFGLRDNSDEAAQVHYFMEPASSLLETEIPTGKFLPVSVGLEVGFRIRLSQGQRYPCRCMEE